MRRLLTTILLVVVTAQATFAESATVSFQYYESLIYVKLALNGRKDLLFLVNTGANRSVIDKVLAAQLKLSVQNKDSVVGSVGREAIELLNAKSIQIGSVTLRDQSITKRDLGSFPTPDNSRLSGILGTDVLARFYVLVDYNKKKITFQSSKPPAFKQNIPFTMSNGFPVVQALINDTLSVPLYLNSGVSLRPSPSIYINVSEGLWRKLKTISPRLSPQSHLTVRGVGGSAFLPVIPVSSIDLGRFRITQPFIIVQPSGGYFKKDEITGFLGNNLLEKYQKVCIDFGKGQISFNPPKSYGAYIYETTPEASQPVKRSQKKRK
jgi:hypothetical protein